MAPTLLTLPSEARLLVYRFLFAKSRIKVVADATDDPKNPTYTVDATEFPNAVTRTCRQLRLESIQEILVNLEYKLTIDGRP